MDTLLKFLWKCEPVYSIAAVEAVLQCLIAFGVPISMEQRVALMGVVYALARVITRGQVSPVDPTKSDTPAGV